MAEGEGGKEGAACIKSNGETNARKRKEGGDEEETGRRQREEEEEKEVFIIIHSFNNPACINNHVAHVDSAVFLFFSPSRSHTCSSKRKKEDGGQ